MTSKNINLDQLREHLSQAKDRLSREKLEILALYPLEKDFNREEYAFAYVRAERLGMRAINRRLSEIDWLPMQLDTRSEIGSESRASMKRWLTSALPSKPDADEFGNDFMHALARCGLTTDWGHAEFLRLTARIANLFRDLSCLIGIVYYCTWLAENRVEDIRLSNPEDLSKTAEEITALMQSPEIYRYLRAPEQNDERRGRGDKSRGGRGNTPAKRKPALHVVRNDNFVDPFAPVPAT
jgi:hypothetical protein